MSFLMGRQSYNISLCDDFTISFTSTIKSPKIEIQVNVGFIKYILFPRIAHKCLKYDVAL